MPLVDMDTIGKGRVLQYMYSDSGTLSQDKDSVKIDLCEITMSNEMYSNNTLASMTIFWKYVLKLTPHTALSAVRRLFGKDSK